jgi:hypothetical protein
MPLENPSLFSTKIIEKPMKKHYTSILFVREMQNHDRVETWADDRYFSYKICNPSEQAY